MHLTTKPNHMPQVKFTTVRDFIENRNDRLKEIAEHIKSILTGSPELKALGEKIEHMLIYIGCPQSVCPMLNRIIFKGVKMQKHPMGGINDAELYGMGHFRWDWKAYTLSNEDMKKVIKAFKYIRG